MWNDKFEVIDFHSHILPSVDDGASDKEMSVKMLESLSSQGVDKVISTSHYYKFSEEVQSFLTHRDESLFRLETYIKEHDLFLPEIIPAAEVRMFPELWKEPLLDKLCIDGTKNILIEMPYDKWTEWMYSEIYALIARGYTPIMAHLERYIDRIPQKEIFTKLLHMDVVVQINAESFEERSRRRFIKKLIKFGFPLVLGTDCHNMTTRRPHIDVAMKYIVKKYKEEYLERIMELGFELTN